MRASLVVIALLLIGGCRLFPTQESVTTDESHVARPQSQPDKSGSKQPEERPPIARDGESSSESKAEEEGEPEGRISETREEWREEADSGAESISMPAMAEPPPVEFRNHLVRVFYATDRVWTGPKSSPKFYGAASRTDGGLDLGFCFVSIPPDHKCGEIERPSIWRLEFAENLDDHVVLINAIRKDSDEYFNTLKSQVDRSTAHQAFVFVHGYNVDFEEAAWRAGQMAFDLNFDGAPILYSWPSHGTVEGYGADVDIAPHAAERLARFLTDVVQKTGTRNIHVIAHSMGARIASWAIKNLSDEIQTPIFNQVVLAAADINANHFRVDIAPRIIPRCRRLNIYLSQNDLALQASQQFATACRLGLSGECLTLFPNQPTIEVIDATSINTGIFGFKHCYYGDSCRLLADLRGLLSGLGAASRGIPLRGGCFRFD